MIRNQSADPKALLSHAIWQATASQRPDGLWTYAMADGVTGGSVYPCGTNVPVGRILACKVSQDSPSTLIPKAGTLVDSGTQWITLRATGSNPGLGLENGPVTLTAIGMYTTDDYVQLRAMVNAGSLPNPFFDGDLMPLA
jgi:hypothetical protein